MPSGLLLNKVMSKLKSNSRLLLRGTVFPEEVREVTEKVEEQFGYVEMPVVCLWPTCMQESYVSCRSIGDIARRLVLM